MYISSQTCPRSNSASCDSLTRQATVLKQTGQIESNDPSSFFLCGKGAGIWSAKRGLSWVLNKERLTSGYRPPGKEPVRHLSESTPSLTGSIGYWLIV
jgi:hypothetical protein